MMRGVLTSKGATIVVAKVGMKVTVLTALVSFIYFCPYAWILWCTLHFKMDPKNKL